MSLFRGAFFLKRGNYRYYFFKYMRCYGYLLKKRAELWLLFWENVAKNAEKSKGYAKSFLMILLCYKELSLHSGNVGIVFMNYGSIYLDMGYLNQNRTLRLKLGNPPRFIPTHIAKLQCCTRILHENYCLFTTVLT